MNPISRRKSRHLLAELLESRIVLATVTIETSGRNEILLPAFDNQLGTLTSAEVRLDLASVNLASEAIPGVEHAHSVIERTCGDFVLGSTTTDAARVLGEHSHDFSRPTRGTSSFPSPSTTQDTYYSCDAFSVEAVSIGGVSHSHAAPIETIFVSGTYFFREFATNRTIGTSVNGGANERVVVPRIRHPFSNTNQYRYLGGNLSVRSSGTLPNASTGNFSHSHAANVSAGPFSINGTVSSATPSGDSVHDHSLSFAAAPAVFTDSADLSANFSGGTTFPLQVNIADSFEHSHTVPAITVNASVEFTYDPFPTSTIVGRSMFYEGSVYSQPAPKTPLFSGETATFDNYSSYPGGIRRIGIDIESDGDVSQINATDFAFRTGNENNVENWTNLDTLPSLSVVPISSSVDRVMLDWPAGTIVNEWLEIRLAANTRTGLTSEDVFYFGNLVGEASGDGIVNAVDFNAVRDNPADFLNPAAITNDYDLNRDARVNAADQIIVRDNVTSVESVLQLITPVTPPSLMKNDVGNIGLPMAEPESSSSGIQQTSKDKVIEGNPLPVGEEYPLELLNSTRDPLAETTFTLKPLKDDQELGSLLEDPSPLLPPSL